MEILILIIIGFCVGYVFGWIYDNTIKKVDSKQEVDDYMKRTYGEYWWKQISQVAELVDAETISTVLTLGGHPLGVR